MIKKTIFIIILSFFISNKLLFASIKISVFINDNIITDYDIEKELKYLEILNPKFKEIKKDQKLKIAKDSLINEIIKKDQVKKNINFEKENELTKSYLMDLYQKLGFANIEEFALKLRANNSYSLSEIEEKIKIELMWNEIIYFNFNNQIKINKQKLIDRIDTLEKESKKFYFLSEIVFNKKNNITIENLLSEIKSSINDIGFSNAANIYSNSPSSKFGGKLGWVPELALTKKIASELKKINKGEYTGMIKSGNDFILLKIEDVKIENQNIDKDLEMKKLVDLERNSQLNRFSKIYFNKLKLNYNVFEK